jgi:hypothetical protein
MRRTGHHAAESPSIRLPRRRIAVTAGVVRATGGVAYRTPDYRDLSSIIARAIGRREATPQGRHDIEGQE